MTKKHFDKLSYGEDLQRQMEMKKEKDKQLKKIEDEEDMLREKQIKELIEKEKLEAETKKNVSDTNLNSGKNRVQFSPVVNTRKMKA